MPDQPDYVAAALRHPEIVTAELTCRAAPVQLEGDLADGRRWYFRARGNTVQFGVGDTADAAVEDTIGDTAAEAHDKAASWLEPADVAYYLGYLVPMRLNA